MAWRFITTGGFERLRAHSRRPEPGAKLVRDPVCGMNVDPATANQRADYGDTTYYFCSPGCRSKFVKDPARYTATAVQLEHASHRVHSDAMAAMPGGDMLLSNLRSIRSVG